MFAVRNYHQSGQVLLAACDPDLLDTRHEEGKFRLEVPSGFYDGHRVDESSLQDYLKRCTVANLVGERTVAVAVAMGVIDAANVLRIGGVPHAQMVII